MAETITKLPVKTDEKKAGTAFRPWRPVENLRREIDRLFEEFDGGIWLSPLARSLFERGSTGVAARLSMSPRPKKPTRFRPNCPGWTRKTSM